MKKLHFFLVVLILIGTVPAISQVGPKTMDPNNQKIKEIAVKVDDVGWVYLDKGKKLTHDEIFTRYKDAFGLGNSDEMIKTKTEEDDLGIHHHSYQQYYKGLKVENFTYLIHEKNGIAEIANGEILENIDVSVKPSLSEKEALEIALKNFKSNEWAWEDPDWEEEKKGNKEHPSWRPAGELIIISQHGKNQSGGLLVYKFELLSVDPWFHYATYINAINGSIEKSISLTRNESTGTVYTLYNGTKSFTTTYRGLPNWDYILKDETRGYICTKNYSTAAWWRRSHIDNSTNTWSTPGEKVNGATAQWTVERAYDYFYSKYNRHGIDNNYQDVRVELNPTGDYFNNAGWSPGASDYDMIIIGHTNPGNQYLAALDIIGHEFTHGVVASEADLIYEAEPGALNESFADIFGTMVEKYVEPTNWNWILGNQVFDSIPFLRSMSNPHEYLQPSTYLTDFYWHDLTDSHDYYGVHTNSGVQNHWFYLLSDGGSQNGVTVSAIGTDKAAKIAYYNLCFYLTAQSGYPAARNGSISAATYLYGECSNECQQVRNAWAAVGVGTPAVPCLSASISGLFWDLAYGEEGHWDAIVSGGSGNYTYSWWVDGSYYSNASSIDAVFYPLETTSYPITLTVTDGTFSDTDEALVHVYGEGIIQSYNPETVILSLSPNPSDGYTSLQIDIKSNSPFNSNEDNEIKILLVDASGRILLSTTIRDRLFEINTSALSNGTYTVVASTNNWKSSTNLIVNH